MRLVLVCLTMILLTSCGKGGSSDTASVKSVFGKWTRISDGAELDFTGGSVGLNQLFLVTVGSNEYCTCRANLTGAEPSIVADIQISNHSGPGTFDCSALIGGYTLTVATIILSLCTFPGGVCEEYR